MTQYIYSVQFTRLSIIYKQLDPIKQNKEKTTIVEKGYYYILWWEYLNWLHNEMKASLCAEVDPRWTHQFVPWAAPLGIYWHAKDFPNMPEVDAYAGETQPQFI